MLLAEAVHRLPRVPVSPVLEVTKSTNSGTRSMTSQSGHSEQRFSLLEQINTSNVARLGVDWTIDLPEAVGPVATPLVADGVMYFVGSRNIVRAVSAATGKLRWPP